MKKIITLLLVIALSLFCFTSVKSPNTTVETKASMLLDGPGDIPTQVLPLTTNE